MVVAGVDASTTATGICVARDGEIIYHTLIKVSAYKEKDAEKRMKIMLKSICDILDQYELYDVTLDSRYYY